MKSILRPTIVISLMLTSCSGGDGNLGANMTATNQPSAVAARQIRANQKDSTTATPDPAAYSTMVQALYVSYFGRPADAAGLTNFEAALAAANAPTDTQSLNAAYSANPAVKSLIDSFGTSAESTALYGSSNTTQLVTAIYQNVLGRAPEQSGLTFWVNAIDSGAITTGNASLSIMAAAPANNTVQGLLDAQVIDNRIAVASDFTAAITTPDEVNAYAGAAALAMARAMLASVTGSTDISAFGSTINTTLATLATTAPSTTYNLYVSTTGSDSNPGTQSAPFLTIQAASRVAQPDTTIHVAAGIYTGGFHTAANGTATTRIRYVSDTKWGAQIVGPGSNYIWLNTGNFVTVDGFDLTGSIKSFGLVSGPWSGGDVGHHFTATNNYIHDLVVNFCGDGGAIDVFSVTGQSIITNNIIKNVNVAQIGSCATMQGIYISDTGSYVANNLVSGVAAVGIQQWHAATNSIIVNNTVFNSKEGILIGSGDIGALPGGSSNNYVANNISYQNTAYGIVESGAGTNNRYVNNLVVGNPINWAVAGTVTATITADPMFVNYQANGTGDYHLQSGSPAIGTGSPTNATTYDLNGIARGSVIDIGAYKY